MDKKLLKNAEGYSDPTVYHALRNIESEERAKKLISVLLYIINASGFELIERIHLRDKRSGKIYK